MGIRILVTAGPTHEPIDAVRYLANRSSGQMGVAIADAAAEAGHAVTLLLGPTAIDPPGDVTTLRYESTADLQGLLADWFYQCDVLIMAAAVADFRMPAGSGGKLERTDAGLTLELQPTPDLVAACAARKRPDQRIIGFALEEPAQLAARAQAKLKRKNLDAIIANPLATMGAGNIEATIYQRDGEPVTPGTMSKPDFAKWLVGWIEEER